HLSGQFVPTLGARRREGALDERQAPVVGSAPRVPIPRGSQPPARPSDEHDRDDFGTASLPRVRQLTLPAHWLLTSSRNLEAVATKQHQVTPRPNSKGGSYAYFRAALERGEHGRVCVDVATGRVRPAGGGRRHGAAPRDQSAK